MANRYLEKIAADLEKRTGPAAKEGEYVPGAGSKRRPTNKRFTRELKIITLENKGGTPPNFKKSPVVTPVIDAARATKRIAGKVWKSPLGKVGIGAAGAFGLLYGAEKAFGDKDIDKVKLD